MDDHVRAGFRPVPCQLGSHGECAICDRITPGSPRYSEGYRRAFHPEEFPDEPATPPHVVVAPLPAPAPSETPSAPVPLAGDLVEALAKRIGADRLAKWAAKWAGVDCGCQARRDALNRLDRAARRFLGW